MYNIMCDFFQQKTVTPPILLIEKYIINSNINNIYLIKHPYRSIG